MDDNSGSFDATWMFVAGNQARVDPDLVNEALRAAPSAVADGGLILPRQRSADGSCRLCGSEAKLSREHVPPKSAGNSDRVQPHTINDWFSRESLDEIPGGTFEQGGVWGYSLCGSCNSRTGRLSHSYRRVASSAARMFVDDLPPVEELNQAQVTKLLRIRMQMHPGAFARLVVSLMCSVAGPWDLAGTHPELRSAILDGTVCALPDGLSLGMLLCAGPYGLTAGPTLHLDSAATTWRWIVVLAHPPLGFELELARSENHPPFAACDIGGFLEIDEATEGDAELEIPIGFTNTAFPGDWRTGAQVERGLDLYGRSVAT